MGARCYVARRTTSAISVGQRAAGSYAASPLARWRAVRFGGGNEQGHCHMLEHEDHDMMRPFVVMPAELMPLMGMHASHGDMS